MCQSYQQLAKNSNLEEILRCTEDGIHPNSSFEFHGFSSLKKVIQKKDQKIEFIIFMG